MNHTMFRYGQVTYTRITKRAAREMYLAGESFYICPAKMRPGGPFGMGMMLHSPVLANVTARLLGDTPEETTTFEGQVSDFCHYNANCAETGTYAAFYKVDRGGGTGQWRLASVRPNGRG